MLFTKKDLDKKDELERMASHEDKCVKYISEQLDSDFGHSLGELVEGKSYHFDTGTKWNLHDLVVHLVKLLGECDMYFSTYAIKVYQAGLFAGMKEDGLIKELHCLLDYRNTTMDEDATQILEKNANSLGYMRTHSKLTVLIGKNHSVVVTGSANMTTNTTADTGVITCNREIGEFRKQWILKNIKENDTNN